MPAAGDFDRSAGVERVADGRYRAPVTLDWGARGRTQGGFVAAQLLLAMTDAVGDPERPLRSFTCHLVRAPDLGHFDVEVTIERAGRTVTYVSGRIVQDGRLMALGIAVFGVDRPGPDWDDLPMPQVEGPDESRASTIVADERIARIAEQLVYQQRTGHPPFSGHGPMEIGGWMGLLERRPLDSAALLVVCDALLMPLSVRMTERLATATIDYTLHQRAPLPRPQDDLAYGHFVTRLLRKGFFEWDGVVWGRDGTVLCQVRQELVLLAD